MKADNTGAKLQQFLIRTVDKTAESNAKFVLSFLIGFSIFTFSVIYDLAKNSKKNFDKKLTKKLLLSQLQPLRIVFYIFLPSLFIEELHITWQSAVMIFNSLPLLIFANTGVIALIELDKLRTMSKSFLINWLILMTIGPLTFEVVGLTSHTLASIPFPDFEHNRWFTVLIATIFSGLGGFYFEIYNYYSDNVGKWFERKNLTQRLKPLLLVIIIGLTTASLLLNPLVQNFLANWFQ